MRRWCHGIVPLLVVGMSLLPAAPSAFAAPTGEQPAVWRDLDASVVSTGILHDRVLPLADLQRQTGDAAAPPVTTARWRQMLHELTRAAGSAPTWPTVAALRADARLARAAHRIPLALLNVRYNQVAPDALARGLLRWRDGELSLAAGVDPAEAVPVRRAFAVAALVPETRRGREVVFDLRRDHIMGNAEAVFASLAVDFDDGLGLRPVAVDAPISVSYRTTGVKILRLRARLADGRELTAACRFEVLALATPAPWQTWPLTASLGYGGTTGTGEAYVYLAPGHVQLTEPVVVVEGFDLDNSMNWDELYALLNVENLLEDLRAEGYDAVVLNFTESTDPIQRNAFVLTELLDQVHAAQVDGRDIVLVGASMGGLVARYALTYLEQQGLDPDVRTFISFDAPQNGASIPLGLQYWLDFFRSESTEADYLLSRLDTPAARQMLLYHHTSPPGATGQADPLRADFLADIAALGDYPQLPRTVAVANGSGDGADQGYAAGAQLIDYEYGSFLVDITGNVWAVPDQSGQLIFDGVIDRIWPLSDDYLSVTVSGTLSWDNAPGGYRNSLAQMDTTAVPYGDIVALYDSHCFIPTISALALATNDPFFDIAGQPDLSTMTPFDAVYYPAENQEHVLVTPQNKVWLLDEIRRIASPATGDGTPAAAVVANLSSRPNPFNPLTRIVFDLSRRTAVRLAVYDAVGRRVRVLCDGPLEAGHHDIPWQGRDAAGRPVASGVYIYRLTAAGAAASGRLVLAR